MEVLYIGSICDAKVFTDRVEKSHIKPSSAPQSFEGAILKGFRYQTDVNLTVMSAESIAPYPHGSELLLKRRIDVVEGYDVSIIPSVNLPVLKQFMHAFNAKRMVKKWLKGAEERQRCILMYGIYPAIAKAVLAESHKHNCKVVAIVTDVPAAMMTYSKPQYYLKAKLGQKNKEMALKVQSKFDAFVYITKQMADIVGPGKPYHVMEILVDSSIVSLDNELKEANPPAIMYAGTLFKKYGIDHILEVFRKVTADCQLWLFGSGDYEEEIKAATAKDPRIKYFGRVDRKTIMEKEQEASLLLNIRNPEDDYTKYSFPSKMIEYMISGTPMLTTRLPGIPKEYYDYVFTVDYDFDRIAQKIDEILNDSPEKRQELGGRAQDFVIKNKNCESQIKKMVDFLRIQTT